MKRNYNETKLSIAFHEHLQNYFPRTPGKLNYTFVANEGRSPQEGAKLKAMGVLAGWFDFTVIWMEGSSPPNTPRIGFLEAKWGDNSYSLGQKTFRAFMTPMGIPCEKFYSVEEGHNKLLEFGIKPFKACQYFNEPNTTTWENKLAAVQKLYEPR